MSPSARRSLLAPLVIVAAAAAAYVTSFGGAFQFDDLPAIVENPTIRRLWPLSGVLRPLPGALTVSGRPFLNLTFALNYALSGYRTWSYHALNLLIHASAALLLWAILRRTLAALGAPGAGRCALAIALLWAVHPLNTESVAYIVQRAESLAGMLYLLTLYAFVRAAAADASGRRDGGWLLASFVACALAMATKEVAASAPVAVLIYDRIFVSKGWRRALGVRGGFYGALAGLWVLLALLLGATGWDRGATTGFHVGVSWGAYWLSQGEALARYAALTFWPHPLSLDYGPPAVAGAPAFVLCAAVLAFLAATAWGVHRGRAWSFPAAVFFLVLAPTSLVPGVLQYAAEHRMYLPLACVLTGAVMGLDALLAAAAGRRWGGFGAVVGAAAAGFIAVTALRDRVYRDDLVLWRDVVAKRPLSALAEANVGQALLERGRLSEAMPYCLRAVALDPNKPAARHNLGLAYAQQKRWSDALSQFLAAASLNPQMWNSFFQAGLMLGHLGQPAQEEAMIRQSLAIKPDQAEGEYDLGLALAAQGRGAEAAQHYAAAVGLQPDFGEAQLNWGIALAEQGKTGEAEGPLRKAIQLMPQSADAHGNLATALDQEGKTDEAVAQYREALRLRPAYAEAHYNLGNALLRERRLGEAREQFAEAVKDQPGFTAAREMLQRLDAWPAQ